MPQFRQLPRRGSSAAVAIAAYLLLQGCAILEKAVSPETAAAPGPYVSLKEPVSKVSYRASDPGPPEAPRGRTPEAPRGKAAAVPQSKTPPGADLSGCDTNKDCLTQLKALVSDEKRDWIGQSVPVSEYASGVRLFAYRALRPSLTCRQLDLALGEIDLVTRTFRSPIPGIASEQIDRVRVLNAQVEQELRAERAKRCAA
jgi:hypothetical protein